MDNGRCQPHNGDQTQLFLLFTFYFKLTLKVPNSLGSALVNFSTNFVFVDSLPFYKLKVTCKAMNRITVELTNVEGRLSCRLV